jgi:hypothetical protein
LNGAHHARRIQDDPDHKARQMRSDRREACCNLLGAIAHYCDLPTLCLSVPQADGSLLPVKLETLADRAGLGLRRAERAMRDIQDAGLVSTHQRAELQEDGTYRGHAAIRVVPPSFFRLFGLEERLKNERKRISQKRTKEQKERQPNKTEKARLRTAIASAMSKITGGEPKAPSTDSASFDLERPPGPAADHIRNIREILEGKAPPGARAADLVEERQRSGRSRKRRGRAASSSAQQGPSVGARAAELRIADAVRIVTTRLQPFSRRSPIRRC